MRRGLIPGCLEGGWVFLAVVTLVQDILQSEYGRDIFHPKQVPGGVAGHKGPVVKNEAPAVAVCWPAGRRTGHAPQF